MEGLNAKIKPEIPERMGEPWRDLTEPWAVRGDGELMLCDNSLNGLGGIKTFVGAVVSSGGVRRRAGSQQTI